MGLPPWHHSTEEGGVYVIEEVEICKQLEMNVGSFLLRFSVIWMIDHSVVDGTEAWGREVNVE